MKAISVFDMDSMIQSKGGRALGKLLIREMEHWHPVTNPVGTILFRITSWKTPFHHSVLMANIRAELGCCVVTAEVKGIGKAQLIAAIEAAIKHPTKDEIPKLKPGKKDKKR